MDNGSTIYGVGNARYSSLSNSRASADLRAKKEIATKVSGRLSLLAQSEANGLSSSTYRLLGDNIEALSSMVLGSCTIKERIVEDDGSVWTLAEFDVSNIAAIAKVIAERKRKDLEEKMELAESQYQELLESLELAARQGKDKRDELVDYYTRSLNDIDPEQFSQLVLSCFQPAK